MWATKYALKHKGFEIDVVPGGFTGIMERTGGRSERLPVIVDDGQWVLDSDDLTMEELFQALALDLSHDFNHAVLATLAQIESSAKRTNAAIQHYLKRSRRDSAWGWAMVHLSASGPFFGAGSYAACELTVPRASGAFDVPNATVGRDLLLGTILAAMISILRDRVNTLAPEEARRRCQKVLGNVAHGCHPLHGIRGSDGMTLGLFVADTYTTCVKASRPLTASNTLEKLYRLFRTWYAELLTAITVERIESWKARRLNEGRSPATVLRDLFTLSSVLRRAVKAGELTDNPVRRIDKPRVDRRGKVRFLDQAEESRLRSALGERDAEIQNQRTRSNERRRRRRENLLPGLTGFGDHLTPAVLLSMNTGLRRGEVLKLRWSCVDFTRRLLTVEGRHAKNRQTRHVPLNEEAVSTLRRRREQSGAGARVFDVATGFRKTWEKLLERANIRHFRWHDLRHHFASRLVQQRRPAEHGARSAGP